MGLKEIIDNLLDGCPKCGLEALKNGTPLNCEHCKNNFANGIAILYRYNKTYGQRDYWCSECKYPIPAGARYCSRCGKKLNWENRILYDEIYDDD